MRELVQQQEDTYGRWTPVFHIGSNVRLSTGPADSGDDDAALGAGNGINKFSQYMGYSTIAHAANFSTMAECAVGSTSAYREVNGTTTGKRAGYEVAALFCIVGHGHEDGPSVIHGGVRYGTGYDLNVRLQLMDWDGSSNSVTGGPILFEKVQAALCPVIDLETQKESTNPIAYLLRGIHCYDATAIDPTQLLGHTLHGIFPEDVWHRARWVLYLGTIVDTEDDTQRLLRLQVRGNTADAPQVMSGIIEEIVDPMVHLVTWTVVGMSADREGIGESGV